MEIALNGVCWILLSLFTCQGVLSQTFTTTSATQLTNQITVGNASDLLIEIICNLTTGTNSWSFSNGSVVSSPLTTFGISQNPEQGLLRIYPGTEVESFNQFTCTSGDTLQNITLLLTESLFFTEPLPAVLYNDVSLNCSLPNIPEAMVINDMEIINGTTLQFCNVSTDRGSFQSRRVPVLPMQDIIPQFVIQPMNTTVLTNRSAGFSCSIRPDNTLVNITWYFDPVPLDIGSGNDNTDRMAITSGVISGLPHFGTSILSLDYVNDQDRGFYVCVALFNNGNFTSSGQAFLELTDNPPNPSSPFRLLPPSTLDVYEGTNVTLPCLASPEFTTNWTYPITSNDNIVITNQTALSIIDVTRYNTGNYICRVNETDATVMLNVLASLQFEMTPGNETTVIRGRSVSLTCVASGNPAPGPIQWFRNNTKLSTEGNILTLTNVQPTDTAIYQCTAQLEVSPYSSIAAHTYLNVQFIDEANVNPDTQLVDPLLSFNFTITCTIPSHPLVNIMWAVGSIPSVTRQLPVGFRGPSVSELSLNSGVLSGTLAFNCSAELFGNISNATAIVNAYSNVTLIDEPDMTEPVLFGFTVTFSCRASSIPRPTISWFRFESGSFMEVVNSPANTTIVSSPVGDRETNSTLTITVDEDNDFTKYRCFADNGGFFNATSRNALLVRGEITSIVADLITSPVVQGEIASFNCSVRGFPQPNVSWIVNGMDSIDVAGFTVDVMNISSSQLNSILTGTITVNQTNIICVAINTFNRVTSDITQIIGGPPLQPDITNISPQSRSAIVEWNAPFSIFDINNYTITLTNGDTNVIFTINDTMIRLNSTHLSPFINYTVTLIANNRAGASPSTIQGFQTLQAAPEGFPTIVFTSSTRQGEIFLQWSPVNQTLRNGIIINYIVEYSTGTNIMYNKTVDHTGAAADMQTTTLTSLEGGTVYTLRILAATIAGEGPFSPTQTQTTISNPPPITDFVPAVPAGVSVTTTTIPLQIPRFNTTNVQFIWVVVIKLNSTVQSILFPTGSTVEPDTRYPTNSSFVSAVDLTGQEIPYGSPYVAAEITLSSSFSLPYTFYIGDNSRTNSINDQPNFYSNPALQEGTTYTSFIRAFPPPVSSSDQRNKRQATTERQYTVFTSTRFSDPQRTSVTSSDTLSDGEIAAIVLVILILFAILVVLIIIALILYFRPRAKFIPPRNRQGSVRLTESQRLLNSPHESPLFRVPTSQVSVVTDLRKKTEFATLPPSDEREPIDITHFPEYVKSLHANSDHLFSEEYELVTIKSPSLAHQASLLPCNQAKNRYANINSYDQSRVVLSSKAGVEGSDYINANYVDGYLSRNAYIACQGPLAETTEDFWRMVWEQKSTCIVMLTNCVEKGRPKCHQYWPQTGSVTLGDMTITLVDQQILAYYTIRTFKLSVGSDTREVKQFHYTAWPDFGVPDHPNPILSFIRRVNNFGHEGPDIVHCSAGVGRSGTYIAIRSMMQMIEAEGKVDIFNFVLDMRHKRNYMVQTEAQYMFVHDALVELIRVGDTEVTVQTLSKELKVLTTSDSDSDICPLQAQFDKLNALDVPIPSQFISGTLPINNAKNRFPDILPYEAYRVRLLMLPGVNGSDYINASYVDGYLRCNQFIMTQGPLQNTIDDFWRMVWEHRVSAIVMLCQLEENGKEQSAQYWPTEKLTQYGDMFIETLNETDTGFYKVREFQITHTKQNNEVRQIKQFHYTDWSENQTPSKSGPIIDMIGLVQKAHHLFGGGPVVVHDCASIGRSGTFCVLNIVIERLKVEGMIDIFFTVHSLRRKHPGIVASYDQYKFCFDTILDYLDSFDKYANFD